MKSLADLKHIRQLEIRTRKAVNTVFSGSYHSIFKGRGMEFSEVREYLPGDDIRSIDWNVTARMGTPFIKKFAEERELTVMLLMDISASGDFGTKKKLKRELGAELASTLAFSAIKNNDRVGLILFTGEVEHYIPPKKGKSHVLRLIRDVLYYKPAGTKTNISSALEYLLSVQKRSAIVFIISDFIDDNYETPLKISSKKYDLIAIEIRDTFEKNIPSVGWLRLFDPETGEEMVVDTSSKKFNASYRKYIEGYQSVFEHRMLKCNIEKISLTTDGDYIRPLMEFFIRREKRLRCRG